MIHNIDQKPVTLERLSDGTPTALGRQKACHKIHYQHNTHTSNSLRHCILPNYFIPTILTKKPGKR